MAKNNDVFTWLKLIRSIWFLLDKHRFKFLFWWLVLVIIHFYSVVPPLLIGKIIDFFTNYKSGQSINIFIFLVLTLGLSYSIVSFIRLSTKQVLGNLRSEVLYFIKVKGFENLLNRSLRWHDGENTGAKVQKIENGINAYKNLMSRINNDLISALTTFIGVVVVFIFLSPKYVIFFVLYAIIFFAILKYYYAKILKSRIQFNASMEKSGGSYIEGLGNILTIKTLGVRDSFQKYISHKEGVVKNHDYATRRIGISMWRSYQLFNGICYALFLLMVGFGVVKYEITVGSIVVFYGYLSSLISSANGILEIYDGLLESKVSISRMMPILHDNDDEFNGKLDFPIDWQKIIFKNVNFRYEKIKKTNLDNVNLQIHRGESIGIVGKTGSGKSTFAKIFAGLYKIDSGKFKIEDVNFNDINKSQISKGISLVLQDSEMFNLSLKDNITLLTDFDEELFNKAIEIAQLKKVIQRLPHGLDTLIGEKGYHLSGGERQRVGIARVIYKNPDVIIFDEATSSLDNTTERQVHQGIENGLKNKTVIIIAHRISTLKHTDRIYLFDNGKIVESGTFDELSSDKKSLFSKIYRSS